MMSKKTLRIKKAQANTTSGVKPPKAMKIYRTLPEKFTRKTFRELTGMEETETYQYLRWLIKFRKIQRTKQGNFQKTK